MKISVSKAVFIFFGDFSKLFSPGALSGPVDLSPAQGRRPSTEGTFTQLLQVKSKMLSLKMSLFPPETFF